MGGSEHSRAIKSQSGLLGPSRPYFEGACFEFQLLATCEGDQAPDYFGGAAPNYWQLRESKAHEAWCILLATIIYTLISLAHNGSLCPGPLQEESYLPYTSLMYLV